MKNIKLHFLSMLLLGIVNLSYSQKQSIFHDENGKIQPLELESYFQSLSSETIEEIQKIDISSGEFVHLATDLNSFYILGNLSQLSISSKNEFYQKIFDEGFSFQINHGIPDGLIWIIIKKDETSIKNGLQRIVSLFQQSLNEKTL